MLNVSYQAKNIAKKLMIRKNGEEDSESNDERVDRLSLSPGSQEEIIDKAETLVRKSKAKRKRRLEASVSAITNVQRKTRRVQMESSTHFSNLTSRGVREGTVSVRKCRICFLM